MSRGPSIAQDIFNDFTNRPGGDIAAYLRAKINSTPPTFETEYLEFKGGGDPRNAAPISDEGIKKIWSKALAGFATTSGGVLVWGIDAREDPATKIEQAGGANLVHDPEAFRTKLQKFMLQATDPPVPGVEIRPVADPTEPGKGFVICLIPESSFRPHQALMADRRWVMRIADNFVDIPTPVLRSLFFPHRQSYLYMKVTGNIRAVGWAGPNITEIELKYKMTIHNDGPASAEQLTIVLPTAESMYPPKGTSNLRWSNYGTFTEFHFPTTLHPGQEAYIPDLHFNIQPERDGFRDVPVTGIKTTFRLFARDQEPVSIAVEFTHSELIAVTTHSCYSTPMPSLRYS